MNLDQIIEGEEDDDDLMDDEDDLAEGSGVEVVSKKEISNEDSTNMMAESECWGWKFALSCEIICIFFIVSINYYDKSL